MKRWLLFGLIIFILPFTVTGNETVRPFSALIIRFEEPIPSGAILSVRTMGTIKWSEWTQVSPDEDQYEFETELKTQNEKPETLFNTNASTDYQYKWKIPDGSKPPAISIEPMRYGTAKAVHPKMTAGLSVPSSIRIIAREQWGANEELLYLNPEKQSALNNDFEEILDPERTAQDQTETEKIIEKNTFGRPYIWPLQYAKNINFVIIHHTASVKNLERPEIAIQNIYYYHAVRRGWGDIGYNYLIDPQGNVYEGRYGGNKVIGGHVLGMNKVSVGIGVLGNYDEGEIPAPVLRSLLSLTNTLAKRYDINPSGSTEYKDKIYTNIMGHKDGGKTTCPGKFLYQKLFGIRKILTANKSTETNTANTYVDESERTYISLPPESETEFEIQIKNTGKTTWDKARMENSLLTGSFEDLRFTTLSAAPHVTAILSNAPVKPGQTGLFAGKIKSSIVSGLFFFEPKLYVNDKMEPGNIPLAVFVEGIDPSYEITARHDPANSLMAGEETEGFIELKNTSNFTWKRSGNHSIKLVANQPSGRTSVFAPDGKTFAVLTQDEVRPGEIGKFLFKLKAPIKSGVYKEYFIPMVSGIRYMDDKGLFLDFNVQTNIPLLSNVAPKGEIRIKLGFPEKAVHISASTAVTLYDGKNRIRAFPPSETIKITKTIAGKLFVRTSVKNYFLTGPVRIESKFDNGVLEIMNWARKDREFRKTIEVSLINGNLTLINELPLEQYLAGIAEETNDTPYEKIKALTILARSYAKFYITEAEKFPGKPYNLDDDPKNSQKYLGYGFEKRAPNIVKAVKETDGQIVTYNGKLIKTPYFSQSDGRTKSAKEAFGWDNTPYLQSVPDPDCAGMEFKGHGVGLSGCGSLAKAKRGETAEQIIKYYYQGVEISVKN